MKINKIYLVIISLFIFSYCTNNQRNNEIKLCKNERLLLSAFELQKTFKKGEPPIEHSVPFNLSENNTKESVLNFQETYCKSRTKVQLEESDLYCLAVIYNLTNGNFIPDIDSNNNILISIRPFECSEVQVDYLSMEVFKIEIKNKNDLILYNYYIRLWTKNIEKLFLVH